MYISVLLFCNKSFAPFVKCTNMSHVSHKRGYNMYRGSDEFNI